MTKQAKKRRQQKRKQAKRTTTTAAPVVETVGKWLCGYLRASWFDKIEEAIAIVNPLLPAAHPRLGFDNMPSMTRCEALDVAMFPRDIALCLTARANLHDPEYVAEARFTMPGSGIIAIWDEYQPNVETIIHEAMHILSGDRDHTGGWDKKHPPFDGGLIRV